MMKQHIPPLHTCYILHTLYCSQFLYELLQTRCVVEVDHEGAGEEAIVGVDVDGAHHDLLFLRDNRGDVRDDADVIVANDA